MRVIFLDSVADRKTTGKIRRLCTLLILGALWQYLLKQFVFATRIEIDLMTSKGWVNYWWSSSQMKCIVNWFITPLKKGVSSPVWNACFHFQPKGWTTCTNFFLTSFTHSHTLFLAHTHTFSLSSFPVLPFFFKLIDFILYNHSRNNAWPIVISNCFLSQNSTQRLTISFAS